MAEPTFDEIKDQFQFTGFSDEQQDVILGQLEQVWETEAGRDMLQDGLNNNGLHYYNINDQSVIANVAPTIGRTPDQVPGIGNFALPSQGAVYLNAYDALDANGNVQTYSGLHPNLDGQQADGKDPIESLDTNGEAFTVPPVYTMIHETNHAARNIPDIPRTRPAGVHYDPTMPTSTSVEASQAYYGANEVDTHEILEQMGVDQLRGSYAGTDQGEVNLMATSPYINRTAPNWNSGDDLGLDQEHDVAVTINNDYVKNGAGQFIPDSAGNLQVIDGNIDMTQHADVRAVVADGDGAATMRMGNLSDTVHAFDGNDTVHTGGGEDRIFLGAGDDTAHAGWGANTIDGGDANLDPASDHRSDMTTDWGFDTVDYTTLPTGFAAPDALHVDTSFDGVGRDGVHITLEGADISVNKGQENSVRVGEDVDALHNIDAVTGTNRDDLAEVTALSGDRVLDGAGGTDTLRIDTLPDSEAVTHNPGPVTFNGVTYDGVVTDGTNNTYYTGFENIVPIGAEQAAADTQLDAPIIPPIDASLDGAPTETLQMEEAVRILHEEGAEAVEMERAAGIEDGPVSHLINTPAGVSVMEELVANGEGGVEVDTAALEGGAYARVSSILRSSMERIEELDKVEEVEDRNAEYLEQAMEADAVVHHMPLSEQVQSAENEMDYDYAL